MKPAPAEARAPHWWENPARLPYCAVCRKFVNVRITRLGAGGLDDDREFVVECHGQRERTVLTAAEVATMSGYGRAFATEGVRDV